MFIRGFYQGFFLLSPWVVKPKVNKALSTVLKCCMHNCHGPDTTSASSSLATGISTGCSSSLAIEAQPEATFARRWCKEEGAGPCSLR